MRRAILLLAICFQCFTTQSWEGSAVLIHGFMSNAASMRPIKSTLKCAGFDTYLWEYQSRRHCIEEHARCLVYFLQCIAADCPEEPIDFVAHSTGGIILRAALNLPGCPEEAKIGRAVLIATPNQGSQLARRFKGFTPVDFFMGNKSGCQLSTYCPSEMLAFGPFPETMQVLVIAGTKGNRLLFDEENDGFVTVRETALETPFYWECFPYSHGDLLKRPKVLCLVRQFMLCGCPETPSAPQTSTLELDSNVGSEPDNLPDPGHQENGSPTSSAGASHSEVEEHSHSSQPQKP